MEKNGWTAFWGAMVCANVWDASSEPHSLAFSIFWLMFAISIYVTEKWMSHSSTQSDK